MSVHMSSKPAGEASRLPAAAWLVLGIVDANLFGLGWRPMFVINIVLARPGWPPGSGYCRATPATAR
jgi:hypothetical protein